MNMSFRNALRLYVIFKKLSKNLIVMFDYIQIFLKNVFFFQSDGPKGLEYYRK